MFFLRWMGASLAVALVISLFIGCCYVLYALSCHLHGWRGLVTLLALVSLLIGYCETKRN